MRNDVGVGGIIVFIRCPDHVRRRRSYSSKFQFSVPPPLEGRLMDGAKLLSRENFHIGIIGVIRVAITLKLCPIWLRVEREREGQIQIPFLIIFTITSGHHRAARWDGFCGTRDMPRFIPIKSLPSHYDIKKIRRLF